ncbi:organic cation transporter protein-like [Crassostrea angulata]|uniref:organic cation transporter protein-like n=1 Tax=Magallana angulata TaxID=2784310 RepID=UPI0022B1DC2F|nr:organic cation transporter protein-like [Crassostrea angulata]
MDSPSINGVKKLDENYIYGRWGAYQVFQSAIAFYNILPTGFQLLIGVFIGYRPNYQCSSSSTYENQTYSSNNSYFVTYYKCHIKVFYNDTTRDAPQLVKDDLCTEGYQYSLDKYSTFVTEMDLVCDRAYLGELVQTLVMAGQLVGAAFASSLSDKWGRKTVHLTSHLLTLAFGIGVAFSPNYITLAILKFIIGVLQQGMVMSDAVLTLELFPEKTRFYAEAIGLFCWTTSLVMMAPIGYLMRDYSWRYLQIVLTGFSLFSLIQYWVQDESLRWLVANGKKEAADKVIHKVARWNKVNYDDLKIIVDKRMASTEQNTQKADKNGTTTENTPQEKLAVEKYSIVTILKHRRILITSLIMWFTWVTNTVTYFGLTLTSTSLAGDRFFNFFLSAIVEYIAVMFEYPMLYCLGRRTITIVFHAVCGISLASATLLNHFSGTDSSAKMASIITTFAGKSAITGSFSTLFLYTPELYPTNLRNAGIGFSSAFSRLGAIISPFAGTLAEEIPWAPGTIFSAMCLTVTLIILYVPETRGVELPQTLVEVKVWYTEKSGLRQQQKVESTKL